jgi:hypothetical protein
VDKRLAQVLPWGTAYFLFFFCDDYYSGKKKYHQLRIYSYNKTIDDFGFQLILRFINPRDLIITLGDGFGANQISGVDKSWY